MEPGYVMRHRGTELGDGVDSEITVVLARCPPKSLLIPDSNWILICTSDPVI